MRETHKLAGGVIACTDRVSCNEVQLHAVLVLLTHRNYVGLHLGNVCMHFNFAVFMGPAGPQCLEA
jgi:hypothetical protein